MPHDEMTEINYKQTDNRSCAHIEELLRPTGYRVITTECYNNCGPYKKREEKYNQQVKSSLSGEKIKFSTLNKMSPKINRILNKRLFKTVLPAAVQNKFHITSLIGQQLLRKASNCAEDVDIELSYTTYPDHEHTVDTKKTPLIFSHGLFGAKGNLHSVSKHLSNEGRKVITYDARNHGDSQHSPELDFDVMSDDLADLIRDLKLTQPLVMGHSMGGKTAMQFALTKPDELKALIVADVAPGPSPGIDLLVGYAKAMKNVDIPAGTSLSFARKQVRLQLSPVVKDEGVLNFLLTNLKEFGKDQIGWRVNLDAFIDNYGKIQGFDIPEGTQFTKPTLFVFGEKSQHYSSPSVSKIKTYFPHAEITAIKDAGHFLHAEKPLEFVKIVGEFCDGVDVL